MSKGLPNKEDDFSAWYNEIVKKADLAENSSVRGCMVIKPYGFSIWEKMQSKLDQIINEELTKIIQERLNSSKIIISTENKKN